MNKIISISALIFFLSSATSFGQNINLPADSITNLLCKKWTVDYAVMGGAKIGKLPNAPEMNYEFTKDKKMIFTSDNNDPKYSAKGNWVYLPDKKLIKFTVDKKNNFNIISLRQDELVILMGSSNPGPNDMPEMQLFCKIKAK